MGREMGRADREMGGRVHLPLGAADVDRVGLLGVLVVASWHNSYASRTAIEHQEGRRKWDLRVAMWQLLSLRQKRKQPPK